MKQKINSLQFFRLIAFLNVFLLHVRFYRITNFPIDAAWSVSFFFMISAFLYGYKFYDKDVQIKDTKKFVIDKIKKFYPIYAIMIFLFFPWDGFFYLKTFFPKFLFKLILCLTMTQSWYPNDLDYSYGFNSPTWFLSTFMFLMIFTIPLCIYFKNKTKNNITNILFIILLFLMNILYVKHIYFLKLPKTEFLYVFPLSRIFEFSIGILLGFIVKSLNKNDFVKIKYKCIFTFFELLTIIILFFSIKYLPSIFTKYYHSVIWTIPNILILLFFSLEKGYLSKFLGNKIFVYLGNLTFNAYIVHKIVYLNVFTIPGINDNMGNINRIIALLYILFTCFLFAELINRIDFKIYFDLIFKIFNRKKKKK